MGSAVTITPDAAPSSQPVTITPDTAQPHIGPDPRSFMQKIEDWYTSTSHPYAGSLDVRSETPQQKVHDVETSVAAGSLPLLGVGLATAPLATLSSLIFGGAGGYAGGAAGHYLGGAVGAPELGQDMGSLAGGYVGGAEAGPRAYGFAGEKLGLQMSAARASAVPKGAQFQNALSVTPEEALRYATSKGIDLTRAEALQTPTAQTIQAVGERSLLGANELAEARDVNAMRLVRNLQAIANQHDPYQLGLTEDTAGRTIQQAARVAQDVARTNAGDAYKFLPPDLKNATIDTSGLRSDYFRALQKAQVSLANRNPQVAAQISLVLNQGSNLGTPAQTALGAPYMMPELTFEQLAKVRSDAIQDGNGLARAGAPSEVQGLYRKLAADADELMQTKAQQMGYAQQWRDANQGWRDYKSKYDDPSSTLYRILDQSDPALVTRSILGRSSASDIHLLRQEHLDGAIEALQRQVITDVANQNFRVGAGGLGGYSDEFLNALFGPAGTKELYINADLGRRMKFQVNPSGTSNVLLGESQLAHPGPSKLGIPMGAARYSMPRSAISFMPQGSSAGLVPPLLNVGISNAAAALQARSGLAYDPSTGRMLRQ